MPVAEQGAGRHVGGRLGGHGLAAAGAVGAVQVDPRRGRLDRRQLHVVIGAREHLVGGGQFRAAGAALGVDIARHVGVSTELACYAGVPFATFLRGRRVRNVGLLSARWRQRRLRRRLGLPARPSPADVVLRLLTLKHIRNWSYEELEREVRANLVYRDFTRIGSSKVPDAKTMARWGAVLGPQVLKAIHERMVKIAQAKGVITGRRMRVDTTVVETDIHYPTDSTLLGDGVRVLTRTMKKITKIVGAVGTKLRDRSRSVKFRLPEIGRIARAKGTINQDRLKHEHDKPRRWAG